METLARDWSRFGITIESKMRSFRCAHLQFGTTTGMAAAIFWQLRPLSESFPSHIRFISFYGTSCRHCYRLAFAYLLGVMSKKFEFSRRR